MKNVAPFVDVANSYATGSAFGSTALNVLDTSVLLIYLDTTSILSSFQFKFYFRVNQWQIKRSPKTTKMF